jgi:hypothetical protein
VFPGVFLNTVKKNCTTFPNNFRFDTGHSCSTYDVMAGEDGGERDVRGGDAQREAEVDVAHVGGEDRGSNCET